MTKDYLVMDTTCGELVGGVFETREGADRWIKEQDTEFRYEIVERE